MSARSRHLFVQRGEGPRLFELDLRAEHDDPADGYVTSASYFAVVDPVRGFVERALDWFRPKLHRRSSELRLLPPFDAQGRDAHRLLEGESHPALDGEDDPPGSVRWARGRITSLLPRTVGDELVLQDLWSTDGPAWRLTDMVDFGLEVGGQPAIAVCCAQCPLVIARPEPCDGASVLAALDPVARERCELDRLPIASGRASRVSLQAGDEVEVLGVVWEPARCRSRFDVCSRGAPFRESPFVPVRLVLGDERGTRMVIVKR